jgi:hypothetical protein
MRPMMSRLRQRVETVPYEPRLGGACMDDSSARVTPALRIGSAIALIGLGFDLTQDDARY